MKQAGRFRIEYNRIEKNGIFLVFFFFTLNKKWCNKSFPKQFSAYSTSWCTLAVKCCPLTKHQKSHEFWTNFCIFFCLTIKSYSSNKQNELKPWTYVISPTPTQVCWCRPEAPGDHLLPWVLMLVFHNSILKPNRMSRLPETPSCPSMEHKQCAQIRRSGPVPAATQLPGHRCGSTLYSVDLSPPWFSCTCSSRSSVWVPLAFLCFSLKLLFWWFLVTCVSSWQVLWN